DVDGSGVKIGVISNSYDTRSKAAEDVGNGDLPGAGNPNGYFTEVHVIKDVTQTFGTLSDEGRAMLQIVHDIAPGANLAFRTGYLGEQDMAVAVGELVQAGCQIIVDDISYLTEPFFADGVISKAIDQAVSDGITFFSSAGNFGNYSHSGVFNPTVAPSTILGQAHDFGGGDVFQLVSLSEGTYTLVLQWDDGSDPDQAVTETDLDIYLTDNTGASRLGFNRENLNGFPIEVVPFSVAGGDVLTNIVIARASGPDVPVTFKYILFRGGENYEMLEYIQGTSTIVGHPNAEGTIAVGAVRYDKNPVYSPDIYSMPIIMSFSSIGGTPVYGEVRNKPDITAPNGVNTTVDLGNGDWSGDPDTTYANFFGTSAASPHAAAVAALIKEAKVKFDSVNQLDPDTIRSLLRSTALDSDDPGDDRVSGSGFIQAHKALLTFANPSPYVENLILVSEEGVPGETLTPVSFEVKGDFFTEQTQIYFRGEALGNEVQYVDEQTIKVDSLVFLGNPSLQAYTPEISSSGLDGGFSEEKYFSDPVKQTVIITANSNSTKYGEVLPDYSASIQLVTVEEDTLSLEEA
ncbi:MAG: S8 family serine peptidase, partial [Bacteroidales bacterium]|nr:S8 family serine peptidase [Bacteroidales bacterium]